MAQQRTAADVMVQGLVDWGVDVVFGITGHHYHDLIDTFSQQDVDLDRVFADVSVYSARVMGKNHVESVTNLACRSALARRGVAHINFPVDIQEMESDQPSPRARKHHV